MRITIAALIAIFVTGSAAAQANDVYKNNGPLFNVSLGFDHTQANAPPGICQCFGASGGYGSVSFFLSPRFAVEARFSGGSTSNISTLGQNLNLYTYMVGPKVNFHIRRISIYADFLLGEGHATNSYFPTGNNGYTTSATSFALEPGGGIDVPISARFSVRAIEANYLHTTFNNGSSNTQNQLQIGAGIVYKFRRRTLDEGPRSAPAPVEAPAPPPPPPPPPPAPAPHLSLDCSADATSVPAGQTVAVTGHAAPNMGLVLYNWNASGGRVLGDGSRVNLDTTALPPGNYTVTGHVAPASDSNMSAECSITFAVTAPPPPPPPPAPVVPSDEEFHANVHDVYFDLNKSTLRPEAIETIRRNSEYLAAHPNLKVLIGGFADQRGSATYNLALGERRATAVRQKLIEDGVAADQIQIVTFGRNSQICTAGNELCWQQNRRVAFLSHP